LDDRDSILGCRKDIYFCSYIDAVSGTFFKTRNGSTFIGEKRPQHEASLFPVSGVEFKIGVTSYPHFPMHLHRDKLGDIVSNKEKLLQIWSEYYKKHSKLQDGTNDGSGEEWTMCVQTAEPYVEPPNDVDIDGNK